MVEGKMQITVEAKSMSFRLEFKLNLYTSKLGKLSDPPACTMRYYLKRPNLAFRPARVFCVLIRG